MHRSSAVSFFAGAAGEDEAEAAGWTGTSITMSSTSASTSASSVSSSCKKADLWVVVFGCHTVLARCCCLGDSAKASGGE